MSQFGGSPPGDDYGFFSPPKAASGGGSQFGGPPAAPSQLGAPAPAQLGVATGFGYPAAVPSGETSGTNASRRKQVAVVAVALVALVGGYFAWNKYQTSRPVTIPATLSGLPQTTEPRLSAAISTLEPALRRDNPDAQLGVQGYGDAKGFDLVIVLRGRVDVDKEFADFARSFGGSVGSWNRTVNSMCAPVLAGAGTSVMEYCIRTSRNLTVEAAAIGEGSVPASSAVEEVWAQQ